MKKGNHAKAQAKAPAKKPAKSKAKKTVSRSSKEELRKRVLERMGVKNNKDFTMQDYIGVDDCVDGVICMKDGRYLSIIEVEPINFGFKNPAEQDNIIDSFASWLRIAPVKMQIKSLSKCADLGRHIKSLERHIESEPNEQCRKLLQNYIELLRQLGSSEGISRRFFIIFEYEKDNWSGSFDEARVWLNGVKEKARAYLKAAGNVVVSHDDDDIFILEALYAILNRGANPDDLVERVKELYNRAFAYYDGNPEKLKNTKIKASDIIVPEKIEFHPKYIIVDGMYYSFLYLPSSSYRIYVSGGWLAGLTNAGEGVDVDIFVHKQDKKRMKSGLRQRQRINSTRLRHMENTGENFEETSKAYSSGQYIKERLAQGEDFYYVSTLITISAKTLDELDQKHEIIKDMMDSNDYETEACDNRMMQAFASYMPFCNLDKKIYEKSKRNVTLNGLSSFYNFTSYEVSDDDGILLGVNKENSSLVIVDSFNTKVYKNANIAILGTSGAGKTFLLLLMALRMRMRNIQTYIIAPLKGHEFKRPTHAVGGEFISLSPGSQHCINIMEIRPIDKSNEMLIDGDAFSTPSSYLSQKIDKLHTFFMLLIPDMKLEEIEMLDSALMQTYLNFDITKDNESLVLKREIVQLDEYGATKELLTYKRMPILGDLHKTLEGNSDAHRITTILGQFVHGSATGFNGQTNVNLSNKFITVDVSELTKKLLPIGMFIALDFIWDKAKEDRTAKKAIMIDETWMLMNENENAANFVLEVFKIIRGYAGGAIAATQDIGDFFALAGGRYGKAIINNSKTKIILQLEPEEAKTVGKIFNFSEREIRAVRKAEQGEALVLSNSNTYSLKITASKLEEKLITTDRSILERIARERLSVGEE